MDHLSDIDFKDFMDLYRKCTAKIYLLLVIYNTLPSDNPRCFQENLLKELYREIITINDEIRD